MSDIFNFRAYRTYLRHEIKSRDERGLITRIAEAAQCQRSHVSRVLNEQLHLTTEQAFRLTQFFQMSSEQAKYFMKLVEYERSGDHNHRESLKNEIAQLRQEQEDLSTRLKEPSIAQFDREMVYYSSWYWSAIHIIVSIPKYRSVDAIAQRLSLNPTVVESCLKRLQEFGLVKKQDKHWIIAGASIHLSKTSPLNSTQHLNWRNRAVTASQQPNNEGVHYTVIQSLSKDDFENVKQLLLKTIDNYKKIAEPSKEEELICFTCDVFKV